jgi:hypothetical protein
MPYNGRASEHWCPESHKGCGMLQEMFNASLAVLRRPSVSTFEEYERDNVGNAALYVIVGTVIAAILGAIGFFIKRPYIEAQLRQA